MPETIGQAEVRLDADTKPFEQKVKNTAKQTDRLANSTRGLATPFNTGGLLAGFLGGGILGIGVSSAFASNAADGLTTSMEAMFNAMLEPIEPQLDKLTEWFVNLPNWAQQAILLGLAMKLLGFNFIGIGKAAGKLPNATKTAGKGMTGLGTKIKGLGTKIGPVGGTTGLIGRFGALSGLLGACLLYTSPSPRDRQKSRMPSSA